MADGFALRAMTDEAGFPLVIPGTSAISHPPSAIPAKRVPSAGRLNASAPETVQEILEVRQNQLLASPGPYQTVVTDGSNSSSRAKRLLRTAVERNRDDATAGRVDTRAGR
jgi:hypothetical protein